MSRSLSTHHSSFITCRSVGITTTIPVEVLYAAGRVPVDLNNIFITAPDPGALVARAERDGYPANVCGWIKGLYGTVLERGIREIVAVTQGDCSQTHAMVETLQAQGVKVVPFAYPFDRDRELLKLQIERLMAHYGATWQQVEATYADLHEARRTVAAIDELSWREGLVTGAEAHEWQVNCSDFGGDPAAFLHRAQAFVEEARRRSRSDAGRVRLGLAGVPPIYSDFFAVIENELGAQIVLVEVPRQFALPWAPEVDLVTCYQRYTYPYDIFGRLDDIERECRRRRIDGVIHYAQAFCFRQIEDLLVKKGVSVPVLTLEGDRPGPVDARTRVRLEAFLEALTARKGVGSSDPTYGSD